MELTKTISVGTTAKTDYLPVPVPGRVRGFRATWNTAVASDDTLSLKKGANEVNALTVGTDYTAAGSVVCGTPDSNNKNLSFDPEGATEDKVIQVDVSALVSAGTLVTIVIDYDEFNIPVRG